jgi:hypothetical protein
MPDLPSELANGEVPGDEDGGSIFYGSRGILISGTYSSSPRLLPFSSMEMFNPPEPTIPRVVGGHANNWVDACLKGGETSSPFSYAGPLTESVLMGNLAIKAFQHKVFKEGKKAGDWAPYQYPGRRTLLWDGENMRVTNYEDANQWVKRDYRAGWEVK